MEGLAPEFILLFLVVSVIWLIVSFFVVRRKIVNADLIGFIIFIVVTIIYLGIAIVLSSQGNVKRVEQLALFTIALTVIYILIECFLAVVYLFTRR